jgi:hypothetical protein
MWVCICLLRRRRNRYSFMSMRRHVAFNLLGMAPGSKLVAAIVPCGLPSSQLPCLTLWIYWPDLQIAHRHFAFVLSDGPVFYMPVPTGVLFLARALCFVKPRPQGLLQWLLKDFIRACINVLTQWLAPVGPSPPLILPLFCETCASGHIRLLIILPILPLLPLYITCTYRSYYLYSCYWP